MAGSPRMDERSLERLGRSSPARGHEMNPAQVAPCLCKPELVTLVGEDLDRGFGHSCDVLRRPFRTELRLN